MVPSSPCIAIHLRGIMRHERQQSGQYGSSPAARLPGQGSSAPGRPRLLPLTWPVLVPHLVLHASDSLCTVGSSSDRSRVASCRATTVSRPETDRRSAERQACAGRGGVGQRRGAAAQAAGGRRAPPAPDAPRRPPRRRAKHHFASACPSCVACATLPTRKCPLGPRRWSCSHLRHHVAGAANTGCVPARSALVNHSVRVPER